jgi:hypothetical protein
VLRMGYATIARRGPGSVHPLATPTVPIRERRLDRLPMGQRCMCWAASASQQNRLSVLAGELNTAD